MICMQSKSQIKELACAKLLGETKETGRDRLQSKASADLIGSSQLETVARLFHTLATAIKFPTRHKLGISVIAQETNQFALGQNWRA